MAAEIKKIYEIRANPTNAVRGFSSFGEAFDSGGAYQARVTARRALETAKTPPLYGTTDIDFGAQGSASVRRTGTSRRGSLSITVNGRNAGDVSYNEDGKGMFKMSADDAFEEVKRRIGTRVKI